jgi:hypothetical protein
VIRGAGGPTVRFMPVEFLTDDEAAAYGRYAGTPSQADLDRVFFLDDEDLKLVRRHRGDHMRAGFALQLVTVRLARVVPGGPGRRPGRGAAVRRGQAAGPGRAGRGEALHRAGAHAVRAPVDRGYREFDDAAEEFARWAAARSRATGDGPKAIFTDWLARLRERDILLPGVTTVARLVAGVVTDHSRVRRRPTLTAPLWPVRQGPGKGARGAPACYSFLAASGPVMRR